MMYKMQTSALAEVANELELTAQSVGLKRYQITVATVPDIYCGTLTWKEGSILRKDNWININICMTERDCSNNENFSNWKAMKKSDIEQIIINIKQQTGGRIGVQP